MGAIEFWRCGAKRMVRSGNLFSHMSIAQAGEQFQTLLETTGVKIERIVSTGQASPPGFWYDQDDTEWVLLVAGRASLRIESEEAARLLRPGDHVVIPAHVRHRVEWTDATSPTIWLAVHIAAD
jgi:cupin 2 domain-containing protein